MRAWLALGLVGLSTAAVLGAYQRDVFSNDGAEYLSVARNLRSGRGLVTSILYYDEHHRLAGVPVPQTVFPPGFPILIAATSLLGLPMDRAALVVDLCCYQLVALLVYRIARRNGGSPRAASVLAVLWLLTVLAWNSVLWRASEMPFILLTLVSAAFLLDDSMGSMVWAGSAAAAGLLVRYAGVFWIVAAGLWLCVDLLRPRRARAAACRLVAFGVLPGLTALSLFLRNHFLVGDAKGGNPFVAQRGPLTALRSAARVVGDLSGFSLGGLAERRPAELVVVACLLACLVAAGMRLRRETSAASKTPEAARTPFASLAMTYIGASLVLLVYLEMTTNVGQDGRLLLPLLPFVLLLAPAGVAVLAGGPKAESRIGLVAAGVFLWGQATLLPSSRVREARATRYATVRDSFERLVADGALAPWEGASPILTNEPHLLGEASGGPVLGLTGPPYAAQVWTTERVRELAAKKGVRYLLFFPLPKGQTMAGSRAGFFESLASPDPPPWLVPLRLEPSAILYSVVSEGR